MTSGRHFNTRSCYALILLGIWTTAACSRKTVDVIGNYESKCVLYLYPSVKLSLEKDSTFKYHFAYREDAISGKWKTIRDTLYLFSLSFGPIVDSFTPVSKNTDLPGKDAYLIRGSKLLKITSNGSTKDCSLAKTEKISTTIRDTCTYYFEDYGSIRGFQSLLDIDQLIKANKEREFYLALVRVFSDVNKQRKIVLKECSSLGSGKVVLFNDTVANFRYEHLSVDSSFLFKHIGDSSKVVYYVDNCGLGFHAPLILLLLKTSNKYLIGYSIDGSNLFNPLARIANRHFIFADDKQKFEFKALLAELEFIEKMAR